MMARPSVRALTEWGTLLGTIRDQAGSGDLGRAVDGDLKFALDHLVDLLLSMEVLVDGRATLEVIVRESHARRMEVTAMPTGQAFDDLEAASVNKGHKGLARQHPSMGRLSRFTHGSPLKDSTCAVIPTYRELASSKRDANALAFNSNQGAYF